eukprot:1016795-Pelagomonas_calceolata.AAC.2
MSYALCYKGWCLDNNKIADSQFHAAQAYKPHGSSRLFTAFIDFRQVYDSSPRGNLWNHLQQCQHPDHFLNIINNLYRNDEYFLIDGDKHAWVRPTYGVRQGCSSSPLLFVVSLNDISDVSEGSEGDCTGTPNLLVSHLLYADDLRLTANSPSNLQTMLHRLKAYARRKFLTVNTQKSKVFSFNPRTDSLPPLV